MTNLYSRTNDEAFDMMEEQWGVVSSKEWEKKRENSSLVEAGKLALRLTSCTLFFSPFTLLSPPPTTLHPDFRRQRIFCPIVKTIQ